MRRTSALLIGVLAVALLAAACGGNDGGSTTNTTNSPAGGGGGSTLKIVDFAFNPATVSVASGGALSIENTGQATHTFTVDGQSIDETFEAGSSRDVTIGLAAGSYPFHCNIHPSMKGTLTVT